MDWFKAKLKPETQYFYGKTMVSGKDVPKTMDKHKQTQALIQGDNECPKCQHNVDPPSHQNCHKSSR